MVVNSYCNRFMLEGKSSNIFIHRQCMLQVNSLLGHTARTITTKLAGPLLFHVLADLRTTNGLFKMFSPLDFGHFQCD